MPDDTGPGQPPPPLFFPPFPNEEKMRKGRLNEEAPLGLLGETHSVGRRTCCRLSVFVQRLNEIIVQLRLRHRRSPINLRFCRLMQIHTCMTIVLNKRFSTSI